MAFKSELESNCKNVNFHSADDKGYERVVHKLENFITRIPTENVHEYLYQFEFVQVLL